MHYIDSASGVTYSADQPRWCGADGAYLNLAPSAGLRREQIRTQDSTLWRYAAAIAVDPLQAVSLGEGNTPLLARYWHGVRVRFKLEFMMPTGSFKDRGMTVMVSHLKNLGVEAVLEDSSGNAGASLSAYAAAAQIHCRILVPQTASYPKIAQIAACGADVVTVPGTRQAVADAALAMSQEIFYASHNWQPFFIEGTKTLAYELWESLGFRAPDNVITPLGYGSNVLGLARGFEELLRNGEISRLPRLFAVQAANCAPCYATWKAGLETPVSTTIRPTIAEGIASSQPTRLREVVQAIRQSAGEIAAVTEGEIVVALGELAQMGFYVEPTCASAVAGLSQWLEKGVIGADEDTVVVLTGSGLKSGERIGQLLHLQPRLL
jgi:threonine synthase